MNNIPQPMAVMQRPPSEDEVAFARARDRAVFAMDVLRLAPVERMNDLRDLAIATLVEYLGKP